MLINKKHDPEKSDSWQQPERRYNSLKEYHNQRGPGSGRVRWRAGW